MTKINNHRRFALLASVSARAFENPGWKMDGDKLAVDGDGNPIWLNSAGQEQSIKGDAISNLNAEAKQHRTAKENAEKELQKYKGPDGKLIDPQTAISAIDTVGKLDAKKLIDAGEVDKVKEQIKGEFTTQLLEKDKALTERTAELNNLRISKVFDGSELVRDRVAVPRDMFEATFKSNFKVGDDGKIEAYDRSGNRLMSKQNPGDYASGEEALSLLVDMHPQKDAILKAQQQNGSGNDGQGGSKGKGRVMKRADFEKLGPVDQSAAATAMSKGELEVVD